MASIWFSRDVSKVCACMRTTCCPSGTRETPIGTAASRPLFLTFLSPNSSCYAWKPFVVVSHLFFDELRRHSLCLLVRMIRPLCSPAVRYFHCWNYSKEPGREWLVLEKRTSFTYAFIALVRYNHVYWRLFRTRLNTRLARISSACSKRPSVFVFSVNSFQLV